MNIKKILHFLKWAVIVFICVPILIYLASATGILKNNNLHSAVESKKPVDSAKPTEAVATVEAAHKGSIFTGNYANLEAQQVQDGELKGSPYAIHLVGQFGKPRMGYPTDTATMVWLTHKQEQISCLHPVVGKQCYKEIIIDMATVPANKIFETITVMPDQYLSCAWNGISLLALLSKPKDGSTGSAFAAWHFDLPSERIIAVPLDEVNCQNFFAEAARKKFAYEFMDKGWGGEAVHGYAVSKDVNQFFHRIGKIEKEDVQLIKREDNPSVNDELYHYQYDGMIISVYVAHIGDRKKIMLNDVVITNQLWSVKYGLNIGTSRKKIEETLGRSMGNPDDPNEWIYGDGLASLTYHFDSDGNVESIKWHSDID
jgi:hypothetical protein